MRVFKSTFLVLITLLGSHFVLAQDANCSLTVYSWNEAAKSSSSRSKIGEFRFNFESASEVKTFLHLETGKRISVGVQEVSGIFGNDSKKLRIAVLIDGKRDVFDDENRAEAETVYDRNWRWLAVSKSLSTKHLVYTFGFGCERTRPGRS